MICQEARPLFDAHLDRELDPATDRELVRHLDECEGCARERDEIAAVKSAVSSQAGHFSAPAPLRRKIETAIANSRLAGRAPAQPSDRRAVLSRWPAVALTTAIAALLAVLFLPRIFPGPESDFLLREVVAAHIRSTQVDHLTDVASSDRHTVKPWFEGKLDFSPPVADFQQQGFKLIGGRVDYLDNRAVAALVYQHGPHFINVFVWPMNRPDSSPAMTTLNGYNIDHFRHARMNYWIVTDMSANEVEQLAGLLDG